MKKSYLRQENERRRTAKRGKVRGRTKAEARAVLRSGVVVPIVSSPFVIVPVGALRKVKFKEGLINGIIDKTQKLYLKEFNETSFTINSKSLPISELKQKYARFK